MLTIMIMIMKLTKMITTMYVQNRRIRLTIAGSRYAQLDLY